MLPDTFLGGVTLSVTNMAVVFLVLGTLAASIELIHAVVSKLGLDSDVVPATPPEVSDTRPEAPTGVRDLRVKTNLFK